MDDVSSLAATEYEFCHPHGGFPVRLRQLSGESLAHLLLAADASYIAIEADRVSEEDLPLVLQLVVLGELLTKGIDTLTQALRERTRLELRRTHDALLDRGFSVLVGAMERAFIRHGGDCQSTDYTRVIGVVIHDAVRIEATLLLPVGQVALRDRGELAPAREFSLEE
jgi:hypothetical protein